MRNGIALFLQQDGNSCPIFIDEISIQWRSWVLGNSRKPPSARLKQWVRCVEWLHWMRDTWIKENDISAPSTHGQPDCSNVLIQENRASAKGWWFMMLHVSGDQSCLTARWRWFWSMLEDVRPLERKRCSDGSVFDIQVAQVTQITQLIAGWWEWHLQTSPESGWLKKRNRVQVCSLWW